MDLQVVHSVANVAYQAATSTASTKDTAKMLGAAIAAGAGLLVLA